MGDPSWFSSYLEVSRSFSRDVRRIGFIPRGSLPSVTLSPLEFSVLGSFCGNSISPPGRYSLERLGIPRTKQPGIAATLNISESITYSYGFGESGTETITAGGTDQPGCIGFVWNQMGTDNYQIQQGNTIGTSSAGGFNTTSYSLNLTDSVSSSWNDTGVDQLTTADEVVGETDT